MSEAIYINPPGLPSEAGFYWWRSSPSESWRMVHVKNYAEGIRENPYLVTYDVQFFSWAGRDLNSWEQFFRIGEWVRALPPCSLEVGLSANEPAEANAGQ